MPELTRTRRRPVHAGHDTERQQGQSEGARVRSEFVDCRQRRQTMKDRAERLELEFAFLK